MNKRASTVLWAATALAAFAIGATIHTLKKSEIQPAEPAVQTQAKKPPSDRVHVLSAVADNLRSDLAEKDQRILTLEAELAEVRAKLPPPLTPEEEKQKKEQEERRKRSERSRARYEKSKELRDKILQRKDKALRAQGLAELAVLLESDDPEEFLLGLTTLPSLGRVNYDKERFKPHVLAALADEETETRLAAFNCLFTVFSREEQQDIMLSFVNDPAPEIRRMVAERIGRTRGDDRDEAVTSALRVLLQDDDKQIKTRAMDALSRRPEYAEEMENLALELSKDDEYAEEMKRWLARRGTISANVAQRLVEMFDEGEGRGGYGAYQGMEWTGRNLSDDAKPIVADFCLRVLRDSLQHYGRSQALYGLRRMRDVSLLPELEGIARSDDAEGIEQQLATTIEYLQRRGGQQR